MVNPTMEQARGWIDRVDGRYTLRFEISIDVPGDIENFRPSDWDLIGEAVTGVINEIYNRKDYEGK